jgi:hypothetical protein
MAVSADKSDGRILEVGDSGHFVCPPVSRNYKLWLESLGAIGIVPAPRYCAGGTRYL